MRRRQLFGCLVALGAMLTLGAINASADQITIGGSTGTITVTCTAGVSCTFSLPAQGVGSATSASFESPTGTVVTGGSYSFTGGPTTLTSSNGGITFSVSSGNGWGFTFNDGVGDVISGTANWETFTNASAGGFSNGQLVLDVTNTSCVVNTIICTDFANGGTINNLFFDMSPDLSNLYQNGGTAAASISSGEIMPNPVPEPGTLALFGTGLIGLAGVVRRKLGKF